MIGATARACREGHDGLERHAGTGGVQGVRSPLLRGEAARPLSPRPARRIPQRPRRQRRGDHPQLRQLDRRPALRGPGDPPGRRGLGRRAQRRGLRRPRLAEGARRRRLQHARAVHLPRGAREGGRAPRRRHRRDVPRLRAHGARQRGAARALHARDRPRRDRVGAGLLGAGRRLRPRLAQPAGGARRRRVRAERAEDLVHPADLGRDLLPRADRPGRAQASRHLVPDGGQPDRARHRDEAAAQRLLRPRPLRRDLLRQRARARGEPDRRGEPRLVRRDDADGLRPRPRSPARARTGARSTS